MARQKIIAGIDPGSSKISTLVASTDELGEEIRVLGVSSVPSRGIRKGQIVNIEEASEAIIESVEAAERMAGYSLSQVFVAVGGQNIASQNSKGIVAIAEPENEITSDDVTRVIEAARAVSLPSSREVIDVLTRTFSIDGQEGIADPIGMSGVRLEVETHIVTGAKTAIRNLSKCVGETGANLSGLIASGMASATSVLSDTEKELGVVLVNFGGGTTSIVVFIEGSPVYTSVLPVGARNVTNDLAIGLRLPLESAEKIKLYLSQPKELKKEEEQEASAEKKSRQRKEDDEIDLSSIAIEGETKTVSRKTLVEGIIRPRLNEVFTLVGEEIKKSGFAGMTPSGLVLCGGGALTVGVVDCARRTLSLPVRVGIPEGVTGLVDDILSPDYATVCGLVKSGLKKGVGESRPSNPIGGVFRKLPIKGVVGRAIDLIKSILP